MTLKPDAPLVVDTQDRQFWLERRKALLVELAAIEQRYGLPRSVPSRRDRERLEFERRRGGEGEG